MMDTKVGSIDVDAVREQFPALHQLVNNHPLAYLDNAATTQRPESVLQAMDNFYRRDNANVHRGVHTLSQRATDEFEHARATVARFVGARHDHEIIFTKGCTEALNLVAFSWGRSNLGPGDVVLVSNLEHHANFVPWQVVTQATGARMVPIPIHDDCSLDLTAYRSLLEGGDVRMVAVKHVCNATGTVNPVAEMSRLAHEHGALVTVDGAQALAHQRVNVESFGADFYSMAAHKVYGPMGMGALYGREELLEAMPPYQTGGGMIRSVSYERTTYAGLPDKFEPGTPYVSGAIGFAAALAWVERVGIDAIAQHERSLTEAATLALQTVPGLRLVGTAAGKAGILSFVMNQVHPHDVGTILDTQGVAVRSGHHCCQPLMARLGVNATTRASLAVYSTEEDLERLRVGLLEVVRVFGGPNGLD